MATKSGVKTLKSYAVGFLLSLLLTLLAFFVVWMHSDPMYKNHLFSNVGLVGAIMALAVMQLCVQVICFLRLNASREGRWELMPFLFAIFIVAIFVIGSLWIMHNLNYNMMN